MQVDPLHGEFVQEFENVYLRNNKNSRCKNLRCFPHCSIAPNGAVNHVKSGFCGSFIKLSITSGLACLSSGDMIEAFGVLITADSAYGTQRGAAVDPKTLENKARSPEQPLNPLIRGEVSIEEDGSTAIIFNRALQSWHYPWASTKTTCDIFHCFEARVYLQKSNQDDLIFLGAIRSPAFQVLSRRRQITAQQKLLQEQEQRGLKRSATNNSEESVPWQSNPGSTCGSASASSNAAAKRQTKVVNWMRMEKDQDDALNTHTPAVSVFSPEFKPNNSAPQTPQHASNGMHFSGRTAPQADSKPTPAVIMPPLGSLSPEYERNRLLDRLIKFLIMYGNRPKTETTGFDSSNSPSSPMFSAPSPCNDLRPPLETYTPTAMPSVIRTPSSEESSSQDDILGLSDLELTSFLQDLDYTLLPDLTDDSSTDQAPSLPHQDEQSEGCIVLYKLLVRYGNMDAARAQNVIDTINLFSDRFMHHALGEIPEYEAVLQKWRSNYQGLRAQIRKEKQDVEWSIAHEYATFDLKNPARNVEQSIFGELRQVMRNLSQKVLDEIQADVEDLGRALHTAAKYCLCKFEPFYPPPTEMITRFKNLFAPHQHEPLFEDIKRGYFTSTENHMVFCKMLTRLRRASYLRLLANRIVESHRIHGRLAHCQRNPIHPDWDCNGTWVIVGSITQASVIREVALLIGSFRGLSVSDFTAAMLGVSRDIMSISVASDLFALQGQKVLFSDPLWVIPFGSPVKVQMQEPLPMGPVLEDRILNSWISRDSDGTAVISVVMGSSSTGKGCNFIAFQHEHPDVLVGKAFNFGEQAKPSERSLAAASLHKTLRDFVIENDAMQCEPVVRSLLRFCMRPGDKSTLTVKRSLYFFARKEDAPAMDNIDELARIPSGCFKALEFLAGEVTYVRSNQTSQTSSSATTPQVPNVRSNNIGWV